MVRHLKIVREYGRSAGFGTMNSKQCAQSVQMDTGAKTCDDNDEKCHRERQRMARLVETAAGNSRLWVSHPPELQRIATCVKVNRLLDRE